MADTEAPDPNTDIDTLDLEDGEELDVIELDDIDFETPQRQRPRIETPLTLAGETYTATRPKDALLFFSQGAVADTANDADQWLAILQLIEGILSPGDRHRFYARCCDPEDPLTAGAVVDALGQLMARWSADSKIPPGEPIVAEAVPDSMAEAGLKPVRIPSLDLVARPPKDIMLFITSAAMGAGAGEAQQAWCILLFLDAALPPGPRQILARRLKYGDLELDDLAKVMHKLIEHWYPQGLGEQNRKTRRTKAARQRKTTKTSATGQGESSKKTPANKTPKAKAAAASKTSTTAKKASGTRKTKKADG